MTKTYFTLRIKSSVSDVMLHDIMDSLTSEDRDSKKRDKNAPLKFLFDCPDMAELPPGESCTCFETSEPVKWYSYLEDMCRISKRYKGILFQLDGRGDEDDSGLERIYFLDGKLMHAGIATLYEPFNPKCLHKLYESRPVDSKQTPFDYSLWEDD